MPDSPALDIYDLLLTKLPPTPSSLIHQAEDKGFHFIGVELNLQRLSGEPFAPTTASSSHHIRVLYKELPHFKINGFHIADSRFMLDERCAKRLPSHFWDSMIRNHCTEYADAVVCMIDSKNQLIGFISCLRRDMFLDLFMVGMHPDHQRQGIGGALMREAYRIAATENLTITTSCFAHNVAAMNFYMSHRFTVVRSVVVMHRWKKGLAYG